MLIPDDQIAVVSRFNAMLDALSPQTRVGYVAGFLLASRFAQYDSERAGCLEHYLELEISDALDRSPEQAEVAIRETIDGLSRPLLASQAA